MSSLSHSLKYIFPISAYTPSPLSISSCIGPWLPSPISNSNLIFQAINQVGLRSIAHVPFVFNQGQPGTQRSEALIQRAPTTFGGRNLLVFQNSLCECLSILLENIGICTASHTESFFNLLTYTLPQLSDLRGTFDNFPSLCILVF